MGYLVAFVAGLALGLAWPWILPLIRRRIAK